MAHPLGNPSVPRLFVFSHPNHELAVFGLLQRFAPRLVYLTDGGGADRVAETREGLASIGLLENAEFLGRSEASFYEALLDRDADFFREVAGRVRESIGRHDPRQVFCDAVEFYNPVHDMALPIVEAALEGTADVAVLEVPLVWERAGAAESSVVQRVPEARRRGRVEFHLTDAETDRKIAARDRVYARLGTQMGPLCSSLPRSHLAREELVRSDAPPAEPDVEVGLRYERRARLLLERGAIERPITRAGHYLPIARALRGVPVP